MNKPNEGWEKRLESISKRFRALRGWNTRRRHKREEQIERWSVVKHPLASRMDY